ncbi:MAG: hypothetical protein OEV86_16065 [Candidatus Krumholzibacteria bacterium]|nr:hypothetical protein [Candidatus Krumholzibacteria bacterium]
MKQKPKTPYQHLLEDARKWAFEVEHPRMAPMFLYDAKAIVNRVGFRMDDLRERVLAADQLGYDVRVRVDNDGNLRAEYVKRPSLAPYKLR